MANYWRLLRTWQRLKTFQYRDLKHIQAFQLNRFKKLLNHAYETIPIYREFYDSHGFKPAQVQTYDDIEKVPIITRDVMQSYPIQKRIDPGAFNKKVYKERTSGSTGQPLEKWTDRTEGLIQTLKAIRFLREWGYSPFHSTIRLWGGAEEKKSIIQKFGLFRRRDIEIVDQSAKATEEVLKSKCDVLYASRSSLEAFADELDKRKLNFRPRILVSTSEMLMKEHRDRFREKFGCETLNLYGSEEIGTIAWECPRINLNLHTDMETVLINFHDVEIQPEGKKGSIIVTNLESFVMPFIRYVLGDQILLPENSQCPCGRTLPLLGQVFGRNDDVVEYNGRKYYWNFFYTIFERENFTYIKKYKIVQTKAGPIEFRVLLLEDSEESRRKCICDLNSAYKDHFSPVNIKFVDEFPLQPNRKFKVLEKET